MEKKKAAERLESVRSAHPGAEGFAIGDELVIMRKPTVDEFLRLSSVVEQRERGKLFADPQKVTGPVLSLVVEGLDAAKAELEEHPQFVKELYELAAELGGTERLTIEDAPGLVENEPKAKQLLGLMICDVPVIVRKVNQFDWSRHTANVANCATLTEAVAKLAADQLFESPDKSGARPQWEALCREYPALPIELGSELQRRARTRAERIAGK